METAHEDPPATLADPSFTRWFVVWVPLAAIALACTVALAPGLWPYALFVDLWVLSFPHVASTLSRTAFRGEDRRAFRWTLGALPLASLAACAAVVAAFGLAALNTGYFFWQTFHYVRQGRGMYRALRHTHRQSPQDPLADAAMYGVALWALAHRVVQHPETFLGVTLALPRVPAWVEWPCAALGTSAFLAYLARELRAVSREGARYEPTPLHYLVTQVVIFVVSYALIPSPSIGWLAANLWHNAQYLLFIHAWNKRRFYGSTRAERGALDGLVAPGRGGHFYAVFALLGAAVYLAAQVAGALSARWWGLGATYLVIVQAINMQHYIADMVLWRAPAKGTGRPAKTAGS
jgi:hypothetical protein